MSDFELSARFILDGSKELIGQLEQIGRAGGQVFGESLSKESQARLDAIVAKAEEAAKRVGIAFNKQKLRFETPTGQIVPDDVFNRLTKLDKGLSDANKSLGQFGREMQAAATGSISALRAKLGQLTDELERVAVGSQSFRRLRREISDVEQVLRSAAQTAKTFRPNLGSSAGLSQELQRLQRIQGRTTSAAGIEALQQRINDVQARIEALNRVRLSVGVEAGSITALRGQLDQLNTQLSAVTIGSQRFKDLRDEISKVESALSRATAAAKSFRPNLGTSAGLSQELQRLQLIQGRTTSDAGVEIIQQRINEVQGKIDALNRRRLTISADPGSIVALRAQLDALNAKLGQVAIGSAGFKSLQREIAGVERELQKAGQAGAIASRGLGLLQGAIGLVGGISAGQFLRSSIQQAMELETATRRLSNTLGPQGAGAALGFVRGISDELGLSFMSLVNSYGSFTAAATSANVPLQQQEGLFRSVSKAGQALGMSNDDLNGVFIALQQIASKSTVSMEELRQQMGDRMPIAMAATAKGLGISTQAMIKLVETGQLSGNKFFPAFTKGLNELTSATKGMPTAAQEMQRFVNEWESMQVALGESVLPFVTAAIKKLTEAIKELRQQQAGADLGFGAGFAGLSDQTSDATTKVRGLQRELNLSGKEVLTLWKKAQRQAGIGTQPLFGNLDVDEKSLKRLMTTFEATAKAYKAAQKDETTETNKKASALSALQGQLDEQVKAQKNLNSLSGQRTNVSALEKEAELTRMVTTGKISQADADRAMASERMDALQSEVAAYDTLIAKITAAKAKGAEEGSDKNLLAAQSARAQKVLEIAKLESEGSKREVQRRQEVLQLAQSRLQITEQQIALENTAGQLAAARVREQQQVAEALLNLQQAQQGLTESLFSVDRARQDYALRSAEEQLQKLRDRGAGVDVIRQQEDRIASLKRGSENIEYRAMQAAIAAAQQRFQLERRVLELKQAQQVLEARGAQRAAAANTLQQRQKLLELQGQLADPSITGGRRQGLEQQVALQNEAIRLAQQQQQAESVRLQTLGTIFGLEQQALAAQQQTTANGFRAQAATKGWEQSLSGPLTSLDAAAGSTAQVAAQLKTVSAGFIQAGGQTIQIKTSLDAAAGSTAAAANAAGALATGYANANSQAEALLGTLQRIATVPQARWAGGDVEPGTRYRINELGRESFLDRAGNLSMISAPQNGFWTPPTAGTVIPAGITASLAAAGAFDGAGGSGGRSRAAAFAPSRGNTMQGAGKLQAAINRLTARMDALVAKDWNVRVVTPSNAGILRSIGGL